MMAAVIKILNIMTVLLRCVVYILLIMALVKYLRK